MANIIYRRGVAMLDDANVSKDINNAISLCTHGYCAKRHNCEIRNHMIETCDELGIFAPITGCAEYAPNSENELTFEFGDGE